MSNLRVWNKRSVYPFDAVLVDRTTPFGNPFPMTTRDDRAAVLDKYRAYLERNPALIARIKRELRGKHLLCWCHPRPCHADILLEIANA